MKKVEIIFQDLSHILSTNNKLPLLKQLKTIDSQLSLLAMVESKKQMYIHTTRSLYLEIDTECQLLERLWLHFHLIDFGSYITVNDHA